MPWGQKFPWMGRKQASWLRSAAKNYRCYAYQRNCQPLLAQEMFLSKAAAFALKYPQLTIIYAHWGGGLLFRLMPELRWLQTFITIRQPVLLYHKIFIVSPRNRNFTQSFARLFIILDIKATLRTANRAVPKVEMIAGEMRQTVSNC